MNSAEQTVTWLITLGVLESPKKSVSDPEAFLQASLQDGVVLCRLLERLRPGTVDKFIQEPRSDSECQRNIAEFIKGCGAFSVELLVKARFAFQPTNEDELSFSKGDVICVTKQVEGGWWEGSLNDRTGWFPSNYVRELKGSGGC
ncbi:rho guanine nucleotide exchange factor 7 [Poecilia reticulata]|uniref:rho guanine nucleotide exchange factor 7 n=1 Tax=Poecilia reticulata TaxID=8081 RepID=UPI0007E959BB|nr:PREDICTED: rho guanine nucleotide exchange factor 7 [Poecilia reticulata]